MRSVVQPCVSCSLLLQIIFLFALTQQATPPATSIPLTSSPPRTLSLSVTNRPLPTSVTFSWTTTFQQSVVVNCSYDLGAPELEDLRGERSFTCSMKTITVSDLDTACYTFTLKVCTSTTCVRESKEVQPVCKEHTCEVSDDDRMCGDSPVTQCYQETQRCDGWPTCRRQTDERDCGLLSTGFSANAPLDVPVGGRIHLPCTLNYEKDAMDVKVYFVTCRTPSLCTFHEAKQSNNPQNNPRCNNFNDSLYKRSELYERTLTSQSTFNDSMLYYGCMAVYVGRFGRNVRIDSSPVDISTYTVLLQSLVQVTVNDQRETQYCNRAAARELPGQVILSPNLLYYPITSGRNKVNITFQCLGSCVTLYTKMTTCELGDGVSFWTSRPRVQCYPSPKIKLSPTPSLVLNATFQLNCSFDNSPAPPQVTRVVILNSNDIVVKIGNVQAVPQRRRRRRQEETIFGNELIHTVQRATPADNGVYKCRVELQNAEVVMSKSTPPVNVQDLGPVGITITPNISVSWALVICEVGNRATVQQTRLRVNGTLSQLERNETGTGPTVEFNLTKASDTLKRGSYQCEVTRYGLSQPEFSANATLIVPFRPNNINVMLVGDPTASTATLTFIVGFDGGGPLTACKVNYYPRGNKNLTRTTNHACVVGNSTVITLSGLTANTDYGVEVVAENIAGSGTSNTVNVLTACSAYRCDPPAWIRHQQTCLSASQLCDGRRDCPDTYSDEHGCGTLTVDGGRVYVAENDSIVLTCSFEWTNLSITADRMSDIFRPRWSYNLPDFCSRLPDSCGEKPPNINTLESTNTTKSRLTGNPIFTASLQLSNIQKCNESALAFRCNLPTLGRRAQELSECDLPIWPYRQDLQVFVLTGPFCRDNDLPSPSNGGKSPVGGNLGVVNYVYQNGSNVMFSCDPAYAVVGDRTAKCLDDGTWSNHGPNCTRRAMLEPVAMTISTFVYLTENFTISLTVDNTANPVDESSIFVEVTIGSQTHRINQSRLSIRELNGTGGNTTYVVVIQNITASDRNGLYVVRMRRAGVSGFLTSNVIEIPVTVCRSRHVFIDATCLPDMDTDSVPDTTDKCPRFYNPDQNEPCLSEQSAGVCQRETDMWSITWPLSSSDTTVTTRCPVQHGLTGNATRMCLNSLWGAPNLSTCTRTLIVNLNATVSRQIGNITAKESATQVALLNGYTSGGMLFPGDLSTSALILSALVTAQHRRLRANETSTTAAYRQNFLHVASNLLRSTNSPSWQNVQETTNFGSPQLLEIVERFSTLEARVSGDTEEVTMAGNITLVTRTITTPQNVMIKDGQSGHETRLPQEMFRRIGSIGRIAVVFLRNVGAVLPNSTTLSSVVLRPDNTVQMINLADDNGDSVAVRDLSEPITMTFNLSSPSANLSQIVCAFYDFTNKRWSVDGLTRTSTNDQLVGTTVCQSIHLTSFSVLVSQTGTTSKALEYLSYIGCGISLFCLILTIFIFSFFKSLRNEHTNIHLNLAISLACAQLLFLIGIERTEVSGVCTAFAIGLHYFFLAAFTWMFIEGLQIYFMLVRVFPSSNERLPKYLALGYLLPVVVVAITAGLASDDYGTKTYCWLDVQSNTRWAFHAPIIAIVLFNIFIVAITVRVVYQRRIRKGDDDFVAAMSSLKAIVVLIPLLGLTWVFGLLAVNENTIVFHYLFVIFNAFQGLFIFVIHCLRNPQVKQAILSYKSKDKGTSYALSEQSTGSAAYHRKKSAQTTMTNISGGKGRPSNVSASLHQSVVSSNTTLGKDKDGLELQVIGGMEQIERASSFGKTSAPLNEANEETKDMGTLPKSQSIDELSDEEGDVAPSTPMLPDNPSFSQKGSSLKSNRSSGDKAFHSRMSWTNPVMEGEEHLLDSSSSSPTSPERTHQEADTAGGSVATSLSPPQPKPRTQAPSHPTGPPPKPPTVVNDTAPSSESSPAVMETTAMVSSSPPDQLERTTVQQTGTGTSASSPPSASSPMQPTPRHHEPLNSPAGSEGHGEPKYSEFLQQDLESITLHDTPEQGRVTKTKRDWRDATVTKAVRGRVEQRVRLGEYGQVLPEDVDEGELSFQSNVESV